MHTFVFVLVEVAGLQVQIFRHGLGFLRLKACRRRALKVSVLLLCLGCLVLATARSHAVTARPRLFLPCVLAVLGAQLLFDLRHL